MKNESNVIRGRYMVVNLQSLGKAMAEARLAGDSARLAELTEMHKAQFDALMANCAKDQGDPAKP